MATAPKRTQLQPADQGPRRAAARSRTTTSRAVYDDALAHAGPVRPARTHRPGRGDDQQVRGQRADPAATCAFTIRKSLKAEELASHDPAGGAGRGRSQRKPPPAAATKARMIADTAQNRLIVAAPIPASWTRSRIVHQPGGQRRDVHGQGAGSQCRRIRSHDRATHEGLPSARRRGRRTWRKILTQALTRKSPSGQVTRPPPASATSRTARACRQRLGGRRADRHRHHLAAGDGLHHADAAGDEVHRRGQRC
ncbi:MAG: hypothetical protein MZV64_71045 [Ignavibacteriales bacterium]|nr:hypothetical protein [Ignavibacteriales bacterium]